MSAPRITSETNDPGRRLQPRIVDTDWLVMRGMAREIRALAVELDGRGQTVVDFGCGAMPYRPLFEAAGATYLGADVDGPPDVAIDAAGRMAIGDASADLVVSFQVLEHVRDLRTYFEEVRRVLRPEGRLILSTHGTWLYHPHPQDHRRWTREGLIAEMADHGLVVERCAAVVGPLAWTTLLRLTAYCYVLRRLPLAGRPMAWALAAAMNARAYVEDQLTPRAITNDNACVYVTLAKPAAGGR